MAQVGTKLRSASWPGGSKLMHWCPACQNVHGFIIAGGPPQWSFDGNYDHPTFAPSMRVYVTEREDDDGNAIPPRDVTICHYFLKAGKIEFCGDSPHALAGQTVDLPDWPYAPGTFGGIDE